MSNGSAQSKGLLGKIASALETLRSVTISSAVLGAFCWAVYHFFLLPWVENPAPKISIKLAQSTTSPQALNGYTEEIIGQALHDQLNEFIREYKAPRNVGDRIPPTPQDGQSSDQQEAEENESVEIALPTPLEEIAALDQLTVPGTETSVAEIVALLEDIAPIQAPQIQIQINQVLHAGPAPDLESTATGSAGEASPTFTYQIKLSGSTVPKALSDLMDQLPSPSQYDASEIPDMIKAISMRLLFVYHPAAVSGIDVDADDVTREMALLRPDPGLLTKDAQNRLSFNSEDQAAADLAEAYLALLHECANSFCSTVDIQVSAWLKYAEIQFGQLREPKEALSAITAAEDLLTDGDDLSPRYLLVKARAYLANGEPEKAEGICQSIHDKLARTLKTNGGDFSTFASFSRCLATALSYQLKIPELKKVLPELADSLLPADSVIEHAQMLDDALQRLQVDLADMPRNMSRRASAIDGLGSILLLENWPAINKRAIELKRLSSEELKRLQAWQELAKIIADDKPESVIEARRWLIAHQAFFSQISLQSTQSLILAKILLKQISNADAIEPFLDDSFRSDALAYSKMVSGVCGVSCSRPVPSSLRTLWRLDYQTNIAEADMAEELTPKMSADLSSGPQLEELDDDLTCSPLGGLEAYGRGLIDQAAAGTNGSIFDEESYEKKDADLVRSYRAAFDWLNRAYEADIESDDDGVDNLLCIAAGEILDVYQLHIKDALLSTITDLADLLKAHAVTAATEKDRQKEWLNLLEIVEGQDPEDLKRLRAEILFNLERYTEVLDIENNDDDRYFSVGRHLSAWQARSYAKLGRFDEAAQMLKSQSFMMFILRNDVIVQAIRETVAGLETQKEWSQILELTSSILKPIEESRSRRRMVVSNPRSDVIVVMKAHHDALCAINRMTEAHSEFRRTEDWFGSRALQDAKMVECQAMAAK